MRISAHIPVVVFALLLAEGAAGQYGNRQGMEQTGMQGMQGRSGPLQPGDGEQQAAQQDTTRRKPKKPLESYFFDDSTRTQQNFKWTVDTYRNRVDVGSVDTMLLHNQIGYPYLIHDVGDAYIGPLGAGSIPLNYNRRPNFRDFKFAEAFYSYLYTPENVPFYNVKRPFTQLSYSMSGKKEQQEESLGIIHAQSVSPSTGFNLNYHLRQTRGMYAWQGAKAKNFSMAFDHTGKRYTVHAGYIYNMSDTKDNGGMITDADLRDPSIELTRIFTMRLEDARNILKNNRYYLVQSYGLPLKKLTDEDFSIAKHPSIFVGNAFEYSRYWKKYTDTRSGTIFDVPDTTASGGVRPTEFYNNWFVNQEASRDSIFESRLSNRIFMQLQPWDRNAIVGVIDGGIGVDLHQYYRFNPDDYLTGGRNRRRETSYYVYGSVEGMFRKYLAWGADMKYNYAGFRAGDLDLDGRISLSAYIKNHPVTLAGAFSQRLASPGYWESNYYSNHYKWFNSFEKESETRFNVTLKAPFLGLEAGLRQSLATNKIYYNAQAMPAQHGGVASLTGLYIHEEVPLGGLHLNHRVLLQWSSAPEVIPVPAFSAFVSYFYEFNIVRGVLRLQLGIDGRYNSLYYAFGYNPATAQFYNQREKRLGDYPMIDAFINAKWKRMRIVVKMQHLDQGMIESYNYFQTLHYPLNARVLKLGISWGFYD
ncbi:MAG: putative porin [Rikenellaceae bacterium]|nr:putative porin [Rikenellaceae bacterium]